MSSTRVIVNKAADNDGETIFRLTDIEPQFVSLVTAGANRQRKFQVVKADEQQFSKGSDSGAPAAGDNVQSGTGNMAGDEEDFTAWLSELEMSIAESINEVHIMANVFDVVDESMPPSVDPDEPAADNAAAVKELAAAKAEIEALKAENATLSKQLEKEKGLKAGLKKQLKSVEDERNKLGLKVTRLKSNRVGGTTSIITGKVDKVEKKSVDKSAKPLWAAGGDMSAALEE